MKISSPISGGVLFKLKKPCKAIKLPHRLVWLDRAVLLHGDEQDVVFEENQQEDSDKSKQIDQTA